MKVQAEHGKKVCDSLTRLFRGQATKEDLQRPELAQLVIERFGEIPSDDKQ
ncbi:hypothetical protein KO507_04160 [Gilvimarinus agarilyticus]|uniref:hypothetical protein n=1 Tax=Gilvimarinus sp. 2_MG-2023 TaxID=3062666 RepID=UPI001C0A3C62|nr:hypothetical protein [Gilvimarinus sp. 2_MG-2023]MBU2884960.1 hypothetical protein [Gilvimarinus agarilyticus]MDO6569859.1 hypothetical protein [Gilvimarinus sp. 2_MG-2023]